MEKANRFPENLRAIRDYWGETQSDLAKAIAVGKPYSGSLISQWEKGSKKPDNDTLIRIATHYHVTVDQLLYAELAELAELGSVEFSVDKSGLLELTKTLLPYATSLEAEEDPLFAKAFLMLQKVLNGIDVERRAGEWNFPEIIDNFRKSYRQNKTIEAACNIMTCLMLDWVSTVSDNAVERFDHLPNNTEMVSSLLKKMTLGQVKVFTQEELEIRETLIDANSEAFDTCLKIAKNSAKWSDFAEYYLGLRYMLGYVDNNYGNHTNTVIGIEMLEQFAKWENHYAQRLFEQFAEMSGHSNDE